MSKKLDKLLGNIVFVQELEKVNTGYKSIIPEFIYETKLMPTEAIAPVSMQDIYKGYLNWTKTRPLYPIVSLNMLGRFLFNTKLLNIRKYNGRYYYINATHKLKITK